MATRQAQIPGDQYITFAHVGQQQIPGGQYINEDTASASSGTLKTSLGLARASIKTVVGLAMASVKTYVGLTT